VLESAVTGFGHEVRLNGGLVRVCNGRALAYRRRTSVKLDLRDLNADRKRCYSLSALECERGARFECRLSSSWFASKLRRLLKRSGPYYAEPYVFEQSFHFDPDALD
jgi:hypothetical protein